VLCVESNYKEETVNVTYLPNRKWMLAKQVNGGHWIHFGTYPDRESAAFAEAANRAFHGERCPSDVVCYSLREV
jgi:hypothetical protein